MKILFILPEYLPTSGGGIATFYRSLLPELIAQGHQVDVLLGTAFGNKQQSYQSDGVNIEFLDHCLIDKNLRKFDRYAAIPELQRYLSVAWTAWEQVKGGQGYDLVETTDWGLLFIPWIVSPDSPPTVVQLHASIGQIDFYDPQFDTQLQASLVRLFEVGLLSFADELQTYSKSNSESWHRLTSRDVRYIPPVVFSPIEVHDVAKSTNGLVVGRIQYWKGPTVLCEALQLLGASAPIIDWIGRDVPYRSSQTSMSEHLSENYSDIWGKKIQPIGTFSPSDTCRFQAQASFVLVPSIWDVFNYTCVESMAQGQAVLCSEGAGASDLIIDEHNGLTCKADSPEGLASSLDKLLSWSDTQRKEIGRAAQQTVHTQLAPALVAQKRIESYERLIQNGKYPVRPNAWIVDAVSPGESLANPLSFLDRLPLRELNNYLLKRTFDKFMRRS
jgi:glycosyltransferase involved in cell wall biosynthesis